MEKEKRRNFTPKQLLDEAQQQKAALAQLGGWQRNAMLASSCGAALAWWGLTGGGARFAFGIAGALLTLTGILCAAVIGLGICNGHRNIERLLQAAESN